MHMFHSSGCHHHPFPISEMIYIVSSGTLNSTIHTFTTTTSIISCYSKHKTGLINSGTGLHRLSWNLSPC